MVRTELPWSSSSSSSSNLPWLHPQQDEQNNGDDSRRKTNVSLTEKAQEDEELIREALQQSPILSRMYPSQVERFVGLATVRRFAPGDVVLIEGCQDLDGLQQQQQQEQQVLAKETVDNELANEQQDVLISIPQTEMDEGPADVDELIDAAEKEAEKTSWISIPDYIGKLRKAQLANQVANSLGLSPSTTVPKEDAASTKEEQQELENTLDNRTSGEPDKSVLDEQTDDYSKAKGDSESLVRKENTQQADSNAEFSVEQDDNAANGEKGEEGETSIDNSPDRKDSPSMVHRIRSQYTEVVREIKNRSRFGISYGNQEAASAHGDDSPGDSDLLAPSKDANPSEHQSLSAMQKIAKLASYPFRKQETISGTSDNNEKVAFQGDDSPVDSEEEDEHFYEDANLNPPHTNGGINPFLGQFRKQHALVMQELSKLSNGIGNPFGTKSSEKSSSDGGSTVNDEKVSSAAPADQRKEIRKSTSADSAINQESNPVVRMMLQKYNSVLNEFRNRSRRRGWSERNAGGDLENNDSANKEYPPMDDDTSLTESPASSEDEEIDDVQAKLDQGSTNNNSKRFVADDEDDGILILNESPASSEEEFIYATEASPASSKDNFTAQQSSTNEISDEERKRVPLSHSHSTAQKSENDRRVLAPSPMDRIEEAPAYSEWRMMGMHPSTFAVACEPHGQRMLLAPPKPPQSKSVRSIYIVRKGRADVWDQRSTNPDSLGPGRMFGEWGFLFGLPHRASVVAGKAAKQTLDDSHGLECWVLDLPTFRQHVLKNSHFEKIVDQYATQVDQRGERYMSRADLLSYFCRDDGEGLSVRSAISKLIESNEILSFLRLHFGIQPPPEKQIDDPTTRVEESLLPKTLDLISKVDTVWSHEAGKMYAEDLSFFHLLLSQDDHVGELPFLLFDHDNKGEISMYDLQRFLEANLSQVNTGTEFFVRYFGEDMSRCVQKQDFPHFLTDFLEEIGRQFFFNAAAEYGTKEGNLLPQEYIKVLKKAFGWRISDKLWGRLQSIYCDWDEEDDAIDSFQKPLATERTFSFEDFVAFRALMDNMVGIVRAIRQIERNREGPVDRATLKRSDFFESERLPSDAQLDILFELSDTDGGGFLKSTNVAELFGTPTQGTKASSIVDFFDRNSLEQIGLFIVSSLVGSVLTLPIDAAKTRMMCHQTKFITEFFKAGAFTGVMRNFPPQFYSVVAEKALKFPVGTSLENRLALEFKENGDPMVKTLKEMMVGATIGTIGVICSQSSELRKVNYHVFGDRGETKGEVARIGHTRGLVAFTLRDSIFFSLYFLTYRKMQELLEPYREAHGMRASHAALIAGTGAAIPCAWITSPFDLIKTRQMSAGTNLSFFDCMRTIYNQGGIRPFFYGSIPRILRVAPQFGVSFMTYEVLCERLGVRRNSNESLYTTSFLMTP